MAGLERFDHVVLAADTGVFDNGALVLSDEFRAAMRPITFTLCTVAELRIAVFFVERPLPAHVRTQIAAVKPEWIDAIAFAEIDAGSEASCAIIDADVAVPATDRPTAITFAVAVVVESHGAFKFVPASYLVRYSDGVAAKVTLAFDWNTESWHGDAAVLST